MSDFKNFTEAQWRERLSPVQFDILRKSGTERAWTGPYHRGGTPGTYHCAGCDSPLFRSADKFDSGCGWPAFSAALESDSVTLLEDRSHFMVRTEVRCASCDGHLGHVFDDGPPPSHVRFCINGHALKHVADT